MYDLIVIGAGPAGAAAAIVAARAGAKVLLLERGRFPRHRVCGEFVSAEALSLLTGLLQAPQKLVSHAVQITSARVFLDGRVLQTEINPPASSIARFDLDAALWDAAIQAGVEARQQTTVQTVAGTGPFRVSLPDEEFETRSIVIAAGRWSNLNAAVVKDGAPSEKWLGIKAHFAEHSPPNSVDLYFFDGGYCGVSAVAMADDGEPAGGRVNACAMVRADIASTLPEVFQQHSALRERSRNWQLLSTPVNTSPLIFSEPTPREGTVLRAGDAAAFVDPFVGDGISLALRSGAMAAQALIPFFEGKRSLSGAATEYEQNYRKQLSPIFRNSSRIRQALLLPKAVRKPALFVLENIPALTRQLVRLTR